MPSPNPKNREGVKHMQESYIVREHREDSEGSREVTQADSYEEALGIIDDLLSHNDVSPVRLTYSIDKRYVGKSGIGDAVEAPGGVEALTVAAEALVEDDDTAEDDAPAS